MILTSRVLRGSLHRLRGIASFAAAGNPPCLPSIPETVQAYGHTWKDDYKWIQSRPREMERVLHQEAEYFHHVAHKMSRIATLSSQLRAEIQNLLPHHTASIGEMIDGWKYISEQSRDRPMPVYSRRRRLPPPTSQQKLQRNEEEKQVLLDVNELEELYGEDLSIGQIKLSKCGNLVACTIAKNGVDDLYSVLVRDVTTGCLYDQPALKGVVSVEWDGDNETLFVTQPDELGRPARVVSTSFSREYKINKRRSKGAGTISPLKVNVLFEELDPRYFLELQRTKDWKYLMINANSKTSSEVHILPTKVNTAAAQSDDGDGGDVFEKKSTTCVQPRRAGLEYFLEHLNDKLYIISNARNDQGNYDLFSIDVNLKESAAMNEKFWTKIEINRTSNKNEDEVFIEDLDVNHNGLVLYQRSCTTGKPEIEIVPIESLNNFKNNNSSDGGDDDDKKNNNSTRVVTSYRPQLPEYAWSTTPGANADFYSDTLRIMLSSPVHPDQAMDLNLKTALDADAAHVVRQQHQWTVPRVIGNDREAIYGHNPDDFILEKVWAPMLSSSSSSVSSEKAENGKDGKKKVPISLIYPKSSNFKGTKHPKPCLAVIYASYGINVPTYFLLERLPLLNRGWSIALIHARGGGELGREWHAAGRGPINKPNSAHDVESALEYLISRGYTTPGSIAMEATSAGAVAAGGVLNSRPDLFGAVVLESPFVDVLSTMIDPVLPLTVHEYEEFGDPSTKQGMQGLQKICPYTNISQKKKDFPTRNSINQASRGTYPPVLITCSSTDARVPIWGPLKYASKLRAVAAEEAGGGSSGGEMKNAVGRGSVLVYADAHGGHLADDREKYDLKSVQYAFLLDAMKQQHKE